MTQDVSSLETVAAIAHRTADHVQLFEGRAGRWYGFWRDGNPRNFATGKQLFPSGFTLVRDPQDWRGSFHIIGAHADSIAQMEFAHTTIEESVVVQNNGRFPLKPFYGATGSIVTALIGHTIGVDAIGYAGVGVCGVLLASTFFLSDVSPKLLNRKLRYLGHHGWDESEVKRHDEIWNSLVQESHNRALYGLLRADGYDVSPGDVLQLRNAVTSGEFSVPQSLTGIQAGRLADIWRYARTIRPSLSDGIGKSLLPSVTPDAA